jgi:hypothetical protein
MDQRQEPVRFSREEALGRVGRRVRSIVGFDGIEAGARGRVMEIDEIKPDGFELIIEWDSRIEGKFQHDWFTKEQYETSLVEDDA